MCSLREGSPEKLSNKKVRCSVVLLHAVFDIKKGRRRMNWWKSVVEMNKNSCPGKIVAEVVRALPTSLANFLLLVSVAAC